MNIRQEDTNTPNTGLEGVQSISVLEHVNNSGEAEGEAWPGRLAGRPGLTPGVPSAKHKAAKAGRVSQFSPTAGGGWTGTTILGIK